MTKRRVSYQRRGVLINFRGVERLVLASHAASMGVYQYGRGWTELSGMGTRWGIVNAGDSVRHLHG